MKSQENIAKRGPVIGKEYEEKLNQLEILFTFIRYAVGTLSNTKREEFVRSLKNQEIERTKKRWDNLRGDFEGIECIFEYERERSEKEVTKKYRGEKHAQYAEWVNDGMISAEILFRITVFEDFLKHVHAAILDADPSILASAEPLKSSTYKDIFAEAFDQYKEQQICRAVEELNRQGMKKRLNYFKEHLQIDFASNRERLIEISDIRNTIAHRHSLEAITKGDTSIPLKELQTTVATVIRSSMGLAFQKGKTKYPHYFK